MEVAATRQAGSVSKKLVEKGDKHSKKRILTAIWRGCLQMPWEQPFLPTWINLVLISGPFPVNMPVIDDVSTGSWFIGLQVHFAAPHGPQLTVILQPIKETLLDFFTEKQIRFLCIITATVVAGKNTIGTARKMVSIENGN
ncbi:hypothetical protein NC652_001072 [Populus alba x Populus x berolinensis]|nr:hypothetical protein NC652_001072 [Populus alba x Populus x berolinensis]